MSELPLSKQLRAPTHHAPAHNRHSAQRPLEQNHNAPRVTGVARQDPEVHPISVRLVVGHDDEPVGEVEAGHTALGVALDDMREVGRGRRG